MDFLTFKSFISLEVLIIFYYIGAIVLPVFAWSFFFWLINKYNFFENIVNKGKEILWQSLSAKQKARLLIILVSFFFFMELFWRMLFEFLIAYMQIRDALLQTQI